MYVKEEAEEGGDRGIMSPVVLKYIVPYCYVFLPLFTHDVARLASLGIELYETSPEELRFSSRPLFPLLENASSYRKDRSRRASWC